MNISILKYLPHRPPMQMVDTITHINDTSIVTSFQIKEDCILLDNGYFTESGLIENMAYFVPKELPENKYYIFGKEGSQKLAKELDISVLGEIPLVQGIREGGDNGKPVVLEDSLLAHIYTDIAQNMINNLMIRNEKLSPTEAVKITNMLGCSSKK